MGAAASQGHVHARSRGPEVVARCDEEASHSLHARTDDTTLLSRRTEYSVHSCSLRRGPLRPVKCNNSKAIGGGRGGVCACALVCVRVWRASASRNLDCQRHPHTVCMCTEGTPYSV